METNTGLSGHTDTGTGNTCIHVQGQWSHVKFCLNCKQRYSNGLEKERELAGALTDTWTQIKSKTNLILSLHISCGQN